MVEYRSALINITKYAAIGFANETLKYNSDCLDDDLLYPSNPFGDAVWLYWHDLDLPLAAVDLIGHYVRRLTDATRTYPVMLERVLAGLWQDLPDIVEREEYEQICARAREMTEERY